MEGTEYMETSSPETEVKGQSETQESERPHSSSQIELAEPESNVYEDEIKNRAFSIDLIWRKLGLCLNYGDLKALRSVNSQFNHFVLNETNFIRRTVVNLDGHRLTPKMFGSTSLQFRHFKFIYSIYNGDEDVDWIYPLLKSAQSLEMVVKSTRHTASYDLSKLLEAPERLEKLTLQAGILTTETAAASLKILSDGAKKNLINLQEFHLSETSTNITDSEAEDLDNEDLKSTLTLLSSHLKNLRVIKTDMLCHCEFLEEFKDIIELNDVSPVYHGFTSLLENNKDTIVELNVNEAFFCTIPPKNSTLSTSLLQMNFPRLKSLTLRVAEGFTTPLVDFLDKNSKYLEELDLTVVPCFPKMILAKIQEKCVGLKRLRMKTKAIGNYKSWDEMDDEEDADDECEDDDEEKGRWEFLKGMTNLQDFALEFVFSQTWANHIPSSCHKIVLSCLPRSVRKISLKNCPTDGLYGVSESFISSDFDAIDSGELTHFEIVGMKSAINNKTMEFICKNMIKLEHLNILGSTEGVSSFGMTGITAKKKKYKGKRRVVIPASSAGFSLKDLKGLKHLSLSGGNLTNNVFRTAVQFQELKYLKLALPESGKNNHLNKEAADWILKNNPSLEVLVTTGKNDKIVFKPLAEMMRLHSRIKVHTELPIDTPDLDESDHEDDDDYDGSSFDWDIGMNSDDSDDVDLDSLFDDSDSDNNILHHHIAMVFGLY